MMHFVAITEEMLVERLVRLFKDNVWKLHGLPESVVSDRGPQFAAELTKELKCWGLRLNCQNCFIHKQMEKQNE